MTERDPPQFLWFPNFCRLPIVFGVVLIAQLVAIITVVPQLGTTDNFWEHLSQVSLFVQWVALLCAGSLCGLRSVLTRLPIGLGLAAAWLVVLAITGIGTLGANWTGANLALVSAGTRSTTEVLASNLAIAGLVAAAALRYFYVQQQWRASVEAEAESRIRALQARIRPHFLYNSMNTVASLIRSRPEVAERTVEDLAELFRQILTQRKPTVSLGEELQTARRYLAIEELRMGERLTVNWQVDALPRDVSVPPLIVQPLVENAIYHGIQPLSEGGEVKIVGWQSNGYWFVSIDNPKATQPASYGEGNQIALDNIRQRLAHRYFGNAKLQIQSTESRFLVTVQVPMGNAS